MPMRVRISESALLPDLVDLLLRNGCVSYAVGEDTCVVVHVHARDADEALRELTFFIRAWRTQHPDLRTVLTG